MFFQQSDLEMTVMDIYELSDKDRKIAELPCREISDDTVEVMSQQSALKMYKVLHDGTQPIMCECEWSRWHPKEYVTPEGVKIQGNDCKSHFRRLNMAFAKRTARLTTEQGKVEVSVEVKASVEVKEPEPAKPVNRAETPLHVHAFKII